MDFWTAMDNFPILRLRLTVVARETLKLPAHNKGNTLRGAFGTQFRRLVCVSGCGEAKACPLDAAHPPADGPGQPAHACPYREIFEPAPPKWAGRLSKNQDAPRPFVFRPPLTEQTTWQPGESFDFELLLFGRAVRALPWFVLSFRTVLEEGFGLNRARCELERVVSMAPGGGEQTVYESSDPVLREAPPSMLAEWIRPRVDSLERGLSEAETAVLKIEFLTPTLLKADGGAVAQPEFHHVFKRIRDRINALSTFYGPGPIDADFAALGKLAEQAQSISSDVGWQERFRTSSRTGQRHELSGVCGDLSCSTSEAALLPWLLGGSMTHVGSHAVWGMGELSICRRDDSGTHGKVRQDGFVVATNDTGADAALRVNRNLARGTRNHP